MEGAEDFYPLFQFKCAKRWICASEPAAAVCLGTGGVYPEMRTEGEGAVRYLVWW